MLSQGKISNPCVLAGEAPRRFAMPGQIDVWKIDAHVFAFAEREEFAIYPGITLEGDTLPPNKLYQFIPALQFRGDARTYRENSSLQKIGGS
jgi:hypothetical protein